MKLLRPVLLGLGIVGTLLLAAVLLAFTPAVQTWAARRVLASQPGIEGSVGKVAAGLGEVRIENLRLRRQGTEVTVPLLEVELPLISAILGRQIRIAHVRARGWTLDLVAPAAVAGISVRPPSAVAGYLAFLATAQAQDTTSVDTTFDGVFSRLRLPVDLTVAVAELEGEVRFARGAGQSPARARIALTGGGLAPGETGRFVLSTEIAVDDPAARVDRVHARHELQLRMDTPRSLDRIAITGAATATGPQFPNGVRVDVETTATRLASAESYGFVLRAGSRVLFKADGELPAGTGALDGTWVLDARSEDLSPFALGRPLPEFSAAGAGKFSLERGFDQIQIAGRVDASGRDWEVIKPELRALGPVRVAADFDLLSRDSVVRVSRLQLEFFSEKPVAGVTLLQGVEYSRATGELRVEDLSSDLLRVSLQGMPLAWAQPWLGDIGVSGGDLKGNLLASVRAGRFVLRSTTALTAGGVGISRDGQILLRGVDLSTDVTLDYAPNGWQIDLARLALRTGPAMLGEFSVMLVHAGGRDSPLAVTGTYAVDLPLVLAQPVMSGRQGLTAGRVAGDFSGSFSTVQAFAATVAVTGLAVNADVALPSIKAELRADRLADGTINGRIPLEITRNNRISDLTLEAEVKIGATGPKITGLLTGNQLFIEDVQVLTSLVPADAPPAAPTVETGPIWGGVTGRIAIDLKKLVYSPAVTANAVLGTFVVGPEAVTFESLSAALAGGATLKLTGGLNFDSRQARSYGLRADLTVSNFDPVPLFRTINPMALPPIEGKFEIVSKLSGQAMDIVGLADSAIGTLKLSSRGGVLRALSVDASEFARTGSKIASVAGLLGLATGDTRALRYAERLKAASELAQQLSGVAFDQLTVDLEREVGNDFVITDLSLISPTVRLLGAGRIRYEPGISVWHQPLSVQLQLGARDKVAENLRVLKLASDGADSLGYTPLLENLQINGTLSAVGASMLKDRLLQALAGQ